MLKKAPFFLLILALTFSAVPALADQCHPDPVVPGGFSCIEHLDILGAGGGLAEGRVLCGYEQPTTGRERSSILKFPFHPATSSAP